MACNCATNEQIAALYRKYGHKVDVPKDATIKFKIKNFFTKIGVGIIVLFAIPYLICYILYNTWFGDGRISLAELFGFRKKIVKEDV